MNLPKVIIGFPLTAALLAGQTVNAPIAGLVLDSQNQLVPVHGVFGNLLRAKPLSLPLTVSGPIDSASFSDAAGIIAAAGSVWLTDGAANVISQQAATLGPALAAFAPDGSLTWFCTGACTELRNTSGAAFGPSFGGAVIALGPAGANSVAVLIETNAQLWLLTLDTATGSIPSQIPIAGAAPAAPFQNGWLTTGAAGLLWTSPTFATPVSIPVPAAIRTLQAAGAHTVAVNSRWLLNGTLQLLEIPAIPTVRNAPKRIQPAPFSPGAVPR